MPADLTERERQILEFIEEFVEANGYPPTLTEIGEMVGLSSKSTVHHHIEKLARRGHLSVQRRGGRTLTMTVVR